MDVDFSIKMAITLPFAPSVEDTKEVLGEYTKAILLNGPKGKERKPMADGIILHWF